MTDDNDETKLSSVKYYILNNDNASKFYDEWRLKTMAIIRKKGWGAHLEDPTVPIPSQAQATSSAATDEVKKTYKDNSEAYDQILMGCSGVPLGLVRRSGGNSRLALSNLDKKYGRTKSDLTETLGEFTPCCMKTKEEDPDKWFMEIDRINDKLEEIGAQYRKKDYELKAHLLGYLPEGYEDVRTKVSGSEHKFKARKVEDEIRNKWKRDFKAKDDKSGNKHALNVEEKGKRRFKGKCHKCGKQGHKAVNCKSDKKGVCFECGEDGHFARDCPNKDKDKTGKLGMFVGITLTVQEKNQVTDQERYLMDSGASCHVVSDEKLLTNLETTDDAIIIGDKSEMKVSKQGVLTLETNDGNRLKLEQVKVVPSIAKNIISVGRIMGSGNKVHMDNEAMTIENTDGNKLKIAKDQDTPLFHLKAKAIKGEQVHNNDEKKKLEIDINDAHELYGHVSEGPLHEILKQRNYVVVGTRKTCEPCAYAKAKARAVGKTTEVQATSKGERLFIDLSGPYKKSLVSSQYWVLIVDDKTRKAWSFFVKNKKEIKKVTENLLLLLKGASVITKYMRCDNAGENTKQLREICEKNGIILEMTAPNTPQMNGVVERKFVTIRDKALALMLGAKLDDAHQGRLWPEAVHTATKLDNAVPSSKSHESPDVQWYGEHPRILDHLVHWG